VGRARRRVYHRPGRHPAGLKRTPRQVVGQPITPQDPAGVPNNRRRARPDGSLPAIGPAAIIDGVAAPVPSLPAGTSGSAGQ